MRYFDNLSAREIGEVLGTTEDSARKRLSRAIEKLRVFFKRNGASTTSTSLSILLSQNMTVKIPENCYSAVLHAVQNLTISPPSASVGRAHFELIQKGAYFAMQTSKYKYLIAAAAILLLGGLGFTGYKGWSYYHPTANSTLVVPGSFVDLSDTSSTSSAGQTSQAQADHEAIASQLMQLANGFNTHDFSSLNTVLAPDLVVTVPNQPQMTRDQLIAQGNQEFITRPGEKMYILLQSMQINGDSATSTDTRRMTNGGKTQNDTMTWAKRNGSWVVVVISNS
jgi:ketosteroid isomerase-like protein